MKDSSRSKRSAQFLLMVTAFMVSIYAVSNLMPLLLRAATHPLSVLEGTSITAYFLAVTTAVGILARAIYRLDKRAGRIRNRVAWFE